MLPFVHIMVQPEGGTLSISDTGKVNISCPTTGYPDPHYEWTYSEGPDMPPIFHPISDDPCLDVSPDGQVQRNTMKLVNGPGKVHLSETLAVVD